MKILMLILFLLVCGVLIWVGIRESKNTREFLKQIEDMFKQIKP